LSIVLIETAIVLAAASGLPAFCLARSSGWGQRIATSMIGGSAIIGLTGASLGLRAAEEGASLLGWPPAGDSAIGVDALSVFFLVPIFLIAALGSIYGLDYWPQHRHPANGRKLQLFWGLLVAGMALLVVSRHAMAFLLGWEVMALAAFFLISTEDHRAECRQSGWIYLIATHVGTLCLFAMFALWRAATGSYTLRPLAADAIDLAVMNGLFFLALLGFGLKAGIMPLHFWLPGAHANAPSHVSALLSGVMIKMGIYGLFRMLSLLAAPPAFWGGLILALGAVSGLLGVLFALGQHDLKRLLAYHSVENIGIILMGLGLAILGRSNEQPEWVVLGLAGSLLHVWNHGLFKSLLFLCAGSVVHATHTREIDRLGGLAKSMPWTAAMFLLGAVAICGLPPLNGFVSELFVYLGLLSSIISVGEGGSAAVVAVPVLAMIGALAVACFVKVHGAVFLGSPRTDAAARAHESPITMKVPMGVLAACCVLIGLAPALVTPVLDAVIVSATPELRSGAMSVATLAPLQAVSVMAAVLLALVAAPTIILARLGRGAARVGTWDCGYAEPTSRMQYTASSFAQTLVGLFGWVLRPHTRPPSVRGLFPAPTQMSSHVDDVVLDRWLMPASRDVERRFGWFRRFQQGLTQHYVLYILLTVIVMLGALMPIDELFARMFAR
jgi:hydrogenase-4 component B